MRRRPGARCMTRRRSTPCGRSLARELTRRLGARALPAGLPETTPRTSAGGADRAGARRAARGVRRVPAARGDRGVADARGAPRDPARHAADARHRQPPEDLLHRRRGALRRAPRSRGRASDRSARRRSTRRRSACAAAPGIRGGDGVWRGDVIGPVIRDLGATLAMRPEPETVRMVLNAQMGKAGAPLEGQGPAHRRLRAGASCRRPRR